MFGYKLLRNVAAVTLVLFTFFVFSTDIVWAKEKEEDALLQARKLYQDGDYEGSIEMLSKFIQKLRAMVEQKKNVAEAFYLLAKIYFEVGDDSKVDENLQKVFETYPTFSKEDESNISFKERVERIHDKSVSSQPAAAAAPSQPKRITEEKPQPARKVITQPYPEKKKKKFPILLVGGAIVVGAAAVLLLKKKTGYNIAGNWIITEKYPDNTTGHQYVTFTGDKVKGVFVDHEGFKGTYYVDGKNVTFVYDNVAWFAYSGNFTDENNMAGVWNWTFNGSPVSGSWSATRGGSGGKPKAAFGSKSFALK